MLRSSVILAIMGLAPFAPQAPPIPEDFVFNAEVDDLEGLPTEAKALYAKNKDGKYELDPVMRKRLDTSSLSSALKAERKKAQDLEKLVKGFKEVGLGDTPEEMLAAIRAAEEGLDPDDKGDRGKLKDLKALREKVKAEADERIKAAVGEKDEQLSKMERSLRKNMLEREAVTALAKHKGSQDLLLDQVTKRLVLVDEGDGELVVRVVDKDGDPVTDGAGNPKTVDQLVKEMRADERYSRAFEPTGKSGTGAKPNHQGRKGGGEGGDTRTSMEKLSAGLATLR